jgi:hypothetical protein
MSRSSDGHYPTGSGELQQSLFRGVEILLDYIIYSDFDAIPKKLRFPAHPGSKMTPKSQPEISDEFLALLGGAVKRMSFRESTRGSKPVVFRDLSGATAS